MTLFHRCVSVSAGSDQDPECGHTSKMSVVFTFFLSFFLAVLKTGTRSCGSTQWL